MLPERLERKIDRSGECHLWLGAPSSRGYGRATHNGRRDYIHRIVYELEVGPIPPGMTVDHVATRGCTSKLCVRVDHLEIVTLAENLRRWTAARDHCRHGHPFDAANTYIRKEGYRVCRRCRADREAERRRIARER